MSAIDHARYRMLRETAHSDYKIKFRLLEGIFEQRKQCAEALLYSDHITGGEEFIEYCNQTIKQILSL